MRAIRPRSRGAADESVVTIDTDSAPRILFYGEDFLCEDLPVGTLLGNVVTVQDGNNTAHIKLALDAFLAEPPETAGVQRRGGELMQRPVIGAAHQVQRAPVQPAGHQRAPHGPALRLGQGDVDGALRIARG